MSSARPSHQVVRPRGAHWGGSLILITLAFTIFEGALRKWVFSDIPTLRYAAYFSKDVVFILAGLAGFAAAGMTNRQYAYWVVVISACFILLPSMSNLPETSLVGSVLAIRAYTVLPCCAFLAAGTIRSFKDIDRIITFVGIAAIVAAVLGLVQFSLPASHVLNRYDSAGEVSGEYGHVRAVGPFAYISGMTVMALAAGWAGTYLFLSSANQSRRLFGVAVAASGLVCALVSMSRGGVLMWLLLVIGTFICFGRVRELLYLALMAALAYWMLAASPAEETMEADMYGATLRRFENSSDNVGSRLEMKIQEIQDGLTRYPLGLGLGAGQPASHFASRATDKLRVIEDEMGRILLEVGIPGFLGVVLIRLLVVKGMSSLLFSSLDKRLRALYAASLMMVTLSLLSNTVFNHTWSSVTWCVVALVFGAMRFGRANRAAAFAPSHPVSNQGG